LLDAGTPSASLVPDRNGGPGLIRYNVCYGIRGPGGFLGSTKTIQHLEYWLMGPDGSVYDQDIHPWAGVQLGGRTGVIARGCRLGDFDDRDLDRPTAATYVVRLEYTFDSGFPTVRYVATAERAIASNLPPRPFMTSLTMTSDVPDDPPTRRDNRSMTFIAAGRGGTPPYQYQWRRDTFVVRDWSPDPKFVWDGSVPAGRASAEIEVLARSAGGSVPEVSKTMIVLLR
jgi:hypothetical protein